MGYGLDVGARNLCAIGGVPGYLLHDDGPEFAAPKCILAPEDWPVLVLGGIHGTVDTGGEKIRDGS